MGKIIDHSTFSNVYLKRFVIVDSRENKDPLQFAYPDCPYVNKSVSATGSPSKNETVQLLSQRKFDFRCRLLCHFILPYSISSLFVFPSFILNQIFRGILILWTTAGSIIFVTAQPIDWQPPIDGTVLLSGTFGELRGNHYHTGIDIKPNVTGHQDIKAVADGYVKEIIVKGGSYGNALILEHSNGFQSLYGHLDHFIPKLDSMIYEYQYKQKNFEVTIFLDSTQFPVTQGMIIATMGNTGHSFGRHCHFEIRNPSGTMYNPLLALPEIQDNSPPQFRNLKINYHDDHGREYQEKIVPVKSLGSGLYVGGELILNAFKYSLAVDVVDVHKNTQNRNGVYSLELYLDTLLIYRSAFDSLSPDDRKLYPEFIDHITSPSSQAIYYGTRYPNNNIFSTLSNPKKGLLRPSSFMEQRFIVKATDYQGNSSSLSFSVRQVDRPSIEYTWMYNYVINPNRSNRVNLDQYSIIFPSGTFVREQRLYLFEEEVIQDNEQITMFHINENQLPLYKKPLLIFKSDLPLQEKNQWTLSSCGDDKYNAIETLRDNDQFSASIGTLGNYCLVKDTLPPEIQFQPKSNNVWNFSVLDNMHSFSSLYFSATVDGNWTLIEADDKNSRLIFQDFGRYRDGQNHDFVMEVTDRCGNTSIWRHNFK